MCRGTCKRRASSGKTTLRKLKGRIVSCNHGCVAAYADSATTRNHFQESRPLAPSPPPTFRNAGPLLDTVTNIPDDTELSVWSLPMPRDWKTRMDEPQTKAELEAIHRSVSRGEPLGSDAWVKSTVIDLGLQSPIRPRSRLKRQ